MPWPDEYERAIDLVSGQSGSAPPIALEHQELLRELGAWGGSDHSGVEEDGASTEAAAKLIAEAASQASQARYEKLAAQREAARLEQESQQAVRNQRKAANRKAHVMDG